MGRWQKPRYGEKAINTFLIGSGARPRSCIGHQTGALKWGRPATAVASVAGLDATEQRNVCFGLKKKFASDGRPNGSVGAASGTAPVRRRRCL